jgi:hypothetical protein
MRCELLNASEDNLRVGELAERHGFVDLGCFAADYRQYVWRAALSDPAAGVPPRPLA